MKREESYGYMATSDEFFAAGIWRLQQNTNLPDKLNIFGIHALHLHCGLFSFLSFPQK